MYENCRSMGRLMLYLRLKPCCLKIRMLALPCAATIACAASTQHGVKYSYVGYGNQRGFPDECGYCDVFADKN